MSEQEISRRRMLKRIGAGAVVVWTAPVITTFAAHPAYAASGGACDCVSDPCFNDCGPPGQGCLCGQPVSGPCACFIPMCLGPCSQNSDCGKGEMCVTNCCGDPTCAQVCSGSKRHTGPRWGKA